jgi:endonuclease YncB( thermonuclease family)
VIRAASVLFFFLGSSLLALGSCGHSNQVVVPDSFPEEVAINLDGTRTRVRWSDGDSFKFLDGPNKGSGVRLGRYNTLESYGPAHRWGDWTAKELFEIAKSSKYLAAQEVWDCTTAGDKDGYGRILVDCPGVALSLVAAGHAHIFYLEGEPPEDLIEAQRKAQKKKMGMWAKGVPEVLITSLHSAAEKESGEAYNRRADTRTGMSTVREHTETYGTCEEVCEEGETGSCMVYVPFKIRYRNKPDCLK